jgi:hypothetical protein
VREIRTLRAMWRALETGPRQVLNGHEGGKPRIQAKDAPTGYRASARPSRGCTGAASFNGDPGIPNCRVCRVNGHVVVCLTVYP